MAPHCHRMTAHRSRFSVTVSGRLQTQRALRTTLPSLAGYELSCLRRGRLPMGAPAAPLQRDEPTCSIEDARGPWRRRARNRTFVRSPERRPTYTTEKNAVPCDPVCQSYAAINEDDNEGGTGLIEVLMAASVFAAPPCPATHRPRNLRRNPATGALYGPLGTPRRHLEHYPILCMGWLWLG
jgi:hypothetical protein